MPKYTAVIIENRRYEIELASDNENDAELEIQAISNTDLKELCDPVETNHWIDDITITEEPPMLKPLVINNTFTRDAYIELRENYLDKNREWHNCRELGTHDKIKEGETTHKIASIVMKEIKHYNPKVNLEDLQEWLRTNDTDGAYITIQEWEDPNTNEITEVELELIDSAFE